MSALQAGAARARTDEVRAGDAPPQNWQVGPDPAGGQHGGQHAGQPGGQHAGQHGDQHGSQPGGPPGSTPRFPFNTTYPDQGRHGSR
ncbi:hypothetical protein [Actinacidiphila yeochonensis]|uniref:hypothetical protein n=1 Tax=Actinacidiphila yeochonensis TaxID=89050 RepID=UPI000566DA32|nr:hypothetical protein [Actinacidiphila yeochonensis]